MKDLAQHSYRRLSDRKRQLCCEVSIAAKSVRPCVQRNKTDSANAQAILTVEQQPGAKFFALTIEAQQVMLSFHYIRAQRMKMRIMQTNAFWRLLYGFDNTLLQRHRALLAKVPASLAAVEVLRACSTDRESERAAATSWPIEAAGRNKTAARLDT